ncbi:hypothetical protein FOL47_002267 [Perkinsus chesapeaki]|uniref:Uncharacterized protein n=1 Tax=Perkinsus chesapeaki TaxID=330153 RepID=A0A7J6MF32_PERCH|nr:hypothetical protein FOL47_002267 [Perkinsus chesapeaki]
MRFSSIWLVLAGQASLTATAQTVGRYVYDQPGAYTLAFDIYENKVAYVIFATGGNFPREGPYPLVEHDSATYTLDFSGTHDGARHLHNVIHNMYPKLKPRDDDLKLVIFSSRDRADVGLASQRLTLTRYGFKLVEGTFKYVEGDPSDPTLYFQYDIRADGRLGLQIGCMSRTPRMPYVLQENEHALPYRSYDVKPYGGSAPLD